MQSSAWGELAAQLDWLWPDATSVVVLSSPLNVTSWHHVRRDPAALLALLGQDHICPDGDPRFRWHQYRPINTLRTILSHFTQQEAHRWIDWDSPERQSIYRQSISIAQYAETISRYTRRCDPDSAWIGGLLAPLGLHAITAIDAESLSDCLADRDYRRYPFDAERELWGLSHPEIARRVARRMRLPKWIQTIVGYLHSRIDTVVRLGANLELFSCVRLAVLLAQQDDPNGFILSRTELREDLHYLHLDEQDLLAIRGRLSDLDSTNSVDAEHQDPRMVKLLPELVRASLGQNTLIGPQNQELEEDIDRIHELMIESQLAEEDRLQMEKLSSLAEFTAGAAHEINNPLAVISGHTQMLLKGEESEKRRESLQSISRQVQRINTILNDLMQFARPPAPKKESISLHQTIQEVVDKLKDFAQSHQVKIQWVSWEPDLHVFADGKQIQTIISALIRNGIEAVPLDGSGWVQIGIHHEDGLVQVAIEDNGKGLTDIQRRHAFDPFYSGRSAGRGSGLGLPVAWRLAKEHGGDVVLEPLTNGPTRFVLRLPLRKTEEVRYRNSA